MLQSSEINFWYLSPTWTRSPSCTRSRIGIEIALKYNQGSRGLKPLLVVGFFHDALDDIIALVVARYSVN